MTKNTVFQSTQVDYLHTSVFAFFQWKYWFYTVSGYFQNASKA